MLGGGAVAEDGGVAAAGAGGGGLAGLGAGLTDEFVEVGGGGGLEEFPVDTAVSPTLYTGL